MKTLAVITGERRLVNPFEMYYINDELRVLVCRCDFKWRIVRKLKKEQVNGYITDADIHLPFEKYDGTSIFYYKLPMLIKKLVKIKNISTYSVVIVNSGNDSMADVLFDNIADIFNEFYIVSTDYDYAIKQAQRLLCEYGIAAHTDEPEEICDVEIFIGSDCCGLGKCVLSYGTRYAINHGYKLPVDVDSRAFAEALYINGLITEAELKKLGVSMGGAAYD